MMIPIPTPAPMPTNTIVTRRGQPEGLLPQRREVDVVVQQHRHAEPRAHAPRDPGRRRAHVVGQPHPARVAVHHARGGDADRQQPVVRAAPPLHCACGHVGELAASARPPALVVGSCSSWIISPHVGGAGSDVGAADVETDDEAGVITHHVGDGAAPTAPVLGTDAGSSRPARAGPRQRPRRLGQTGGRRDLGTGHRPATEDRLQHGLLAELAQSPSRIRRRRRAATGEPSCRDPPLSWNPYE